MTLFMPGESISFMQPGTFRDRRWFLQAVGASAATAGCSLLSQPTLDSPPRWYHPPVPRPPVIFIHGAFGARLAHGATGKEIWPIGVGELVVGSFDDLALPLDPDSGEALEDDIVPTGLFEEAGMVEFYGSLVTMLVEAGGYARESPGTPVGDEAPRFYACIYDWRRDLSRAAGELDALIEQVRSDHGQPDLKVDLVVHSSGGLVARYYLLHGGKSLDALPEGTADFAGTAKVNRVIAIGTPELGMTRAVAALVEGEPVVLSRVHPEVLATAECPCQLLPHGDDTWLVDAMGRPIDADSCDPETWRRYEMGVFDHPVRERVRAVAGGRRAGRARLALLERAFALRLARARRFRAALRVAPVPASVPYFSIGGDCRRTQARVLIEHYAGSPRPRTRPDDVGRRSPSLDYARLMYADGDGMVTRASTACRPGWPATDRPVPVPALTWASQEFVCASHNQLVVNVDCQRALLRALVADASQ